MPPTTTRARRAQPLLLALVVALLLVGGFEASAPTAPTTGSNRAPGAETRQAIRHPADAIVLVTPQRPVLVRGLRSASRSSVRWVALLVAALLGALAIRRRGTHTALPFVRTVVSRDLVRRRGPPAFASA